MSFLLEISFLYLLRTSSCFSRFLFWVLIRGVKWVGLGGHNWVVYIKLI